MADTTVGSTAGTAALMEAVVTAEGTAAAVEAEMAAVGAAGIDAYSDRQVVAIVLRQPGLDAPDPSNASLKLALKLGQLVNGLDRLHLLLKRPPLLVKLLNTGFSLFGKFHQSLVTNLYTMAPTHGADRSRHRVIAFSR